MRSCDFCQLWLIVSILVGIDAGCAPRANPLGTIVPAERKEDALAAVRAANDVRLVSNSEFPEYPEKFNVQPTLLFCDEIGGQCVTVGSAPCWQSHQCNCGEGLYPDSCSPEETPAAQRVYSVGPGRSCFITIEIVCVHSKSCSSSMGLCDDPEFGLNDCELTADGVTVTTTIDTLKAVSAPCRDVPT